MMMRRMLDGIPVELGIDYLAHSDAIKPRLRTIYTGPIDAFFNHCLGRLAYRGQCRVSEYLPDTRMVQPVGQVNEPQHSGGAHIRTLEWKHMMTAGEQGSCSGTVITREYPFSPADPDQFEYPLPDQPNRELYASYRSLAAHCPEVVICGRLGEYRYYDMDHAIARAFEIAESLLPLSAVPHKSRRPAPASHLACSNGPRRRRRLRPAIMPKAAV
jgi:UDP-galactopyranose mutase